jgi:hypothetical protein
VSGFRLALALIGGPILLLTMVDRAIVLDRPLWNWIAREAPPQQLDPLRVEAILRTTPSGRRNVFVLGDSTAEAAVDPGALDRALAPKGRLTGVISIGGAPTVTFGLLARSILALDPSAVVLVVSPYTLRDEGFYDQTYTYDARVVPDLFVPSEILSHLSFHLQGLAGQALQRVAAIRLGLNTWTNLRIETLQAGIRASREKGPLLTWTTGKNPVHYPNPNTRAIALLARRLRARGAKLVVVESPVHPLTGLYVGEKRYARFRKYLGRLAGEERFTFVAAPDLPDFPLEEFRDQTHLNEVGRRAFTDAIAHKLDDLL